MSQRNSTPSIRDGSAHTEARGEPRRSPGRSVPCAGDTEYKPGRSFCGWLGGQAEEEPVEGRRLLLSEVSIERDEMEMVMTTIK